MTKSITLTPDDWTQIKAAATGRNDPKAVAGVEDKRRNGGRSSRTVNVVGLAGEFAVAKMLGVAPDTAERLGGDNGYDLRLRDGRTVDVKCTAGTKRNFLLPSMSPSFRADVAILCWLPRIGGNVLVVGWLYRLEVWSLLQVRDFGHGKTLFVDWKHFKPF